LWNIPLSRDDDRLTNTFFPHSSIRILCNSKQVGLKFSSPSPTVRLDDLGAILSNALKWVHGNQNNATICVDTMLSIAIPNSVKDWTNVEAANYIQLVKRT
jgi:hypothetical protein